MLRKLAMLCTVVTLGGACQADLDHDVDVSRAALISEPLPLRGVSLAGAEFSVEQDGSGDLPGVAGANYIYPDARYKAGYDSPRLFRERGMTTFRLPFRWERLQPTRNAAFDAKENDRLTNTVRDLLATGAEVILDPHNYARYGTDVIGSPAVPESDFADFWGRLGAEFSSEPDVIFGLMNEPYGLPSEQWVSAANAAIAAIRASGATNLVLVPGTDYSGASSWFSSVDGAPNAVALLAVADSGNNFAIDVHTYLNPGGSGTTEDCESATIGSEKLAPFTTWLSDNGLRAALTEFGGGSNAVCALAIDDLLDHLEAHSDVYLGWTYWSAGPWWGGKYPSIEPDNPNATSQWSVLAEHLVASSAEPQPTPPAGATVVYADGLAPGWVDWSWGFDEDVETNDPALGTAAIQFTFATPGGLKLAHADAGDPQPIDPAAFTHVVLHLRPTAPISGLELTLENGSNSVAIASYATLTPNVWTEVRVPLADVNDAHAAFSFIELTHPGGATLGVDAIWLESAATPPPPTTVSYRQSTETLVVDGTTRQYLLVQPTPPTAASLPLIVAFHGDGGSAGGYQSELGIERQANGRAVVVYPESVTDSFESWTLDGRQSESRFVQALVQSLGASGLVRTDRVFLTGLSGGGVIANALGCSLGASTIRAVGISSGPLYSTGDFTTAPSGALSCDLPPAIIIWGEEDGAGSSEGQEAYDTKFDVAGTGARDAYRATFGCAAAASHAISPDPCVAYDGCSKPLDWCAIPGMGHAQWSKAAEATWSFFASQL